MAMAMPKIQKCEMLECSYNLGSQCHAMAITVGGEHAMCDTLLMATHKGGIQDMTGSIGACKVEGCSFNQSFECTASGVSVGMHHEHADCLTFQQKR